MTPAGSNVYKNTKSHTKAWARWGQTIRHFVLYYKHVNPSDSSDLASMVFYNDKKPAPKKSRF